MLNSPTFVALLSKAKVHKSQVIPGLKVIIAQHDIATGDVQVCHVAVRVKQMDCLHERLHESMNMLSEVEVQRCGTE